MRQQLKDTLQVGAGAIGMVAAGYVARRWLVAPQPVARTRSSAGSVRVSGLWQDISVFGMQCPPHIQRGFIGCRRPSQRRNPRTHIAPLTAAAGSLQSLLAAHPQAVPAIVCSKGLGAWQVIACDAAHENLLYQQDVVRAGLPVGADGLFACWGCVLPDGMFMGVPSQLGESLHRVEYAERHGGVLLPVPLAMA